MTTIAKIAFFICLFMLCFMNFEGIIDALFYGPIKTYTIGQIYDSRKSTERTNISLYESFSMELLHKTQKKLKFIDLLNLQEYNHNMQGLFESVSPLMQMFLIPWKLNQSNIEAFVIAVNHSLKGEDYYTQLRIFQFDDNQEVGFEPYETLQFMGRPAHVFQGNESLHIYITKREENVLLSVLPSNILKQQAIVHRTTLNKSCEILMWDECYQALVYILESNPFIFYTQYNNTVFKTNVKDLIVQTADIVANPIKMSLVKQTQGLYLIICFTALRKNSIALKYVQYKLTPEGNWSVSKSGIVSVDIGINPKQYVKLQRQPSPPSHYSWQHRLYFLVLNRIYIVSIESDRFISTTIPLKQKHYLNKIVSFDQNYRLLLKYQMAESPQSTILQVVLLQKDLKQILQQTVDRLEDCYDVGVQTQGQSTILFVLTQLEYLDVYTLIEHDNPSILKGSFKKILATYALYKFSGLNLFERYFEIF